MMMSQELGFVGAYPGASLDVQFNRGDATFDENCDNGYCALWTSTV